MQMQTLVKWTGRDPIANLAQNNIPSIELLNV